MTLALPLQSRQQKFEPVSNSTRHLVGNTIFLDTKCWLLGHQIEIDAIWIYLAGQFANVSK